MSSVVLGWTVIAVSIGFAAIACVDEETSASEEAGAVDAIDIASDARVSVSPAACRRRGLEVVALRGMVRYFGWDLLQDPPTPRSLKGIAGVKVSIAEFPFTKQFDIRTDDDGKWQMHILKQRGQSLRLSFLYEKDHYPEAVERQVFPGGLPDGWHTSVIQSNVHTVGSADINDIAMQMPDEIYLYYAKTQLEAGIESVIGAPYPIANLAVATVGKSWASIYDPALPHGDPGAIVTVVPSLPSPLMGPIYFDETVTPNPRVTQTSVDGGVLFNNLPEGEYVISAEKAPYTYDKIVFNVSPSIHLYVSSPPHSIQGTNDAAPGEM
jgi:hypothetical protein